MIHLAFLWHMHQPAYRDGFTGEGTLPWVRLHGVKDYWGMARLLKDRPPVKATFNWVPCLVEQLCAAADGSSADRALRVARVPADALEWEEVLYMLRSSFRANRERLVYPHGRFGDLLDKRGDDPAELKRRAAEFTVEDLRDLQVWSNLAWFHRILQKTDPVVSTLVRKGARFTEEEKNALLDRQREILAEILPAYRALAQTGQVEITTSPYFHPILPLLLDMESARAAMPDAALPALRSRCAGDARLQMAKAVALHTEVFGAAPRGLWPPEGSVSEAVVPLAADHGFAWMASDEGVLGRSLGLDLHRDGSERLVKPHVLYKPYVLSAGGAEIRLVFRDRLLSDLVGFRYQHMSPRQAVTDFLDRLRRINEMHPYEDLLVCVILDGENPWESYPDGGVDLLSLLYARLADESWIRTVTLSDYLDTRPDPARLERLHAGSWIDSNFSVWVGSREDNLAWEALGRVRDHLEREEPNADPAAAAQAREALLAAEGSDWFWWYGDRFSSEEDEDFDALFRKHLGNVYRFLGEMPPEDLLAPIAAARRTTYSEPVSYLDVVLDGETTQYFEWSGAGEYDPARDYSSMGSGLEAACAALRFGFGPDALFLRLDLKPTASDFLEGGGELRLLFPATRRAAFLVRGPGGRAGALVASPEAADGQAPRDLGSWAAGKVLEIAAPFDKIGTRAGDVLRFQVELLRRGRVLDRFPRGGAFELRVPGPDFEAQNWFV